MFAVPAPQPESTKKYVPALSRATIIDCKPDVKPQSRASSLQVVKPAPAVTLLPIASWMNSEVSHDAPRVSA